MSAERLQKVLASAGVASRRDCEELISSGRVTVNGQVMTELGARVDMEQDEIAVDGKPITQPDERTYVMLNKPVGVVATADDPQGRPTVVELVNGAARLFPVGRLDADSEGLLLMTDDGELTHRLTHPSFEVEKEYRVLLDHMPSADALRQWREGVMLEGERTAPAWVEVLESADGGVWVRAVLREGRKRQIREVAALLGYEVLRLIRVREDTLLLGDLPPGESRPLTEQEVAVLKAHTVVAAPRAPASRATRSTRKPAESGGDERQPMERAAGERAPRARTPYGRGEDNDRGPRSGRDEGDFRERRDDTGDRGSSESAPPSRRDDRWNDRASRSNDRREERPVGGRDYGSQREGGYRDQRSYGNDRREGGSRRDEGGYRDRRDERPSGGRDYGSQREGGYRDQRSYGNDRRESGSRRDEGGYRDRSASRDYGSGSRRDEGGYRDQRSYGNDRREGGSAPRGYNSQRESNYRDQRDQRANDTNDRREGNFRRDEGSYRDRSSSAPRDYSNRRDDRAPTNRGSSSREYGNRDYSRGNSRDDRAPSNRRDEGGYRDQRSSSNDRRDYGNDRRSSSARRDEGGYRDQRSSSNDRRDYGNDRRPSGDRRDAGGYRDQRDTRSSGERGYSNRREGGDFRDERAAPRRDTRQGSERPNYGRNDEDGARAPRPDRAPAPRGDSQPRAPQQEGASGPGRAWRERQEEEAKQRKARVTGGARVARGNFRSRIAGRPAFPVRSRPRSNEGNGEGEAE